MSDKANSNSSRSQFDKDQDADVEDEREQTRQVRYNIRHHHVIGSNEYDSYRATSKYDKIKPVLQQQRHSRNLNSRTIQKYVKTQEQVQTCESTGQVVIDLMDDKYFRHRVRAA